MKILFVSRAFPPTIGGIEKQNAELAQFLGNKASLTLIANTWGKSFLPAFLPYALIKMLFLAKQHDVVLLGDGVLAPWGAIVKILFPRTPVASIIHGLDITFARQSGFLARAYRLLNIPSLQKLDGVICVSQDTKTLAESFGIDPTRTSVIPNGVDPASFSKTHSRDELKELIGRDRASKKVILRLGRFVRHKGVEWFIRNVMPQLPDHVILVAAGGVAHAAHPGDSNTFPSCEAAIQELGLEKRVVLLPNLHRDKVNILLSTADLAVAPNIPVQGTGDGFGIAVIEASINRLPIVVSKLGGLQEAVADGHNGLFAEPGNATDFVEKITWLLADDARRKTFGEKARDYTLAHYSWDQLADRYREVLSGLVSKNK
jgi:phosphatidylinositol alpha-1,6-mannosyltransferase